jgi:hypothetical protein
MNLSCGGFFYHSLLFVTVAVEAVVAAARADDPVVAEVHCRCDSSTVHVYVGQLIQWPLKIKIH